MNTGRLSRLASGIAGRLERRLAQAEQNEKLRCAVFCLILALTGVLMYALNCHTPIMVDDYDYCFSYATGEIISSPADVFKSQAAHYMIWGGRLMHCFTQMFLYLGKPVFNAANTVMYLLLLLEIYAIARPKRRFCWTLLLAEHMMLFSLVSFFGSVFLWLTGACMYLWGTAFALLPVLIMRSTLEEGWFSRGRLRALLFFPVGLIAGWTNENTTIGVIALTTVVLLLCRMQEKRLPKRLAVLWAGQCAGALLLLLAPGNFVRASSYAYDSMLAEMLRRMVLVCVYTVVYLGMPLCGCLLCGALLRGRSQRMGAAAVLVFGALVASAAMIGSPELSDRTYTGAFALVLAALMTLLGQAEEHIRAADCAKILALPLLLVVCAHGGYKAVKAVGVHEAAWHTQLARIDEAKERGEGSVQLESVESVSPYTFSIILDEDSAVWPNSTLGRYFGLEIRGTE